jgi:hypothetical protein
MVQPPNSVLQLLASPLAGLAVGAFSALLLTPMLGEAVAWATGMATGIVLASLLAWMTLRSNYGSRHGLLAAAIMLILLLAIGCSAIQLLLAVMRRAELARLAGWTTSTSILIAFAGTAWLRFRRLIAEGFDSAWIHAHLDLDLGRLRRNGGAFGIDEPAAAVPVSPWLLAALGVNMPLLYRAWGVSDTQALPFVVGAVLGAAVWLCVAYIGPMAGTSLFLAALEHRLGRRLLSPDFEALQALRRSNWLTRLLMPATPEHAVAEHNAHHPSAGASRPPPPYRPGA